MAEQVRSHIDSTSAFLDIQFGKKFILVHYFTSLNWEVPFKFI